MSELIINIAAVEEQSLIYGPGVRYVIWTQGCSIHCPGCWNKDMWSFKPKKLITVSDLCSQILALQTQIEGITILGGEPFDQYRPVLELVKCIRQKSDLSIILYTGYEVEQLKTKNQTEVFDYIDILIAGPYRQELRTMNGGLIGSTNQQIIFLTDRYSEDDLPQTNEIEINIESDGSLTILGYPDDELINKIFSTS